MPLNTRGIASILYFQPRGAAYTRTDDLRSMARGPLCSRTRLDNGGFLLTGGAQRIYKIGRRILSSRVQIHDRSITRTCLINACEEKETIPQGLKPTFSCP